MLHLVRHHGGLRCTRKAQLGCPPAAATTAAAAAARLIGISMHVCNLVGLAQVFVSQQTTLADYQSVNYIVIHPELGLYF